MRGFKLSGDEEFLEPFLQGERDFEAAVKSARRNVDGARARLDEQVVAAREWQALARYEVGVLRSSEAPAGSPGNARSQGRLRPLPRRQRQIPCSRRGRAPQRRGQGRAALRRHDCRARHPVRRRRLLRDRPPGRRSAAPARPRPGLPQGPSGVQRDDADHARRAGGLRPCQAAPRALDPRGRRHRALPQQLGQPPDQRDSATQGLSADRGARRRGAGVLLVGEACPRVPQGHRRRSPAHLRHLRSSRGRDHVRAVPGERQR